MHCSNLTGTLDVTVNGQEAVLYNITCVTDTDKEDNEWIAKVWLDDKGAEGKVYTIPLSEDETAYVNMGP